MEWRPTSSAPDSKRILVADEKGRIQIARLAGLRWFDDADHLIGRATLVDAAAAGLRLSRERNDR